MIFTIVPSLRSSIIVMSIGAMKIGISRGSTGSGAMPPRAQEGYDAQQYGFLHTRQCFAAKYHMYRISSVASISTTASMPAAKP